jgi:aspartyl aminopeptidase
MEQTTRDFARELIDFIHAAPTRFHVVQSMEQVLAQHGFTRLSAAEEWELERGGSYYLTVNGSACVAFTVGAEPPSQAGFRILEAHTDSPEIRIKPFPEIVAENHYTKLNAEVYGSPILNTWLDRPLSLAGRVTLRGKDPLQPREVLINAGRPLLYIPNLSIHHNKNVNSGVELNKQKDMLPLLGITVDGKAEERRFYTLIAEEAGVEPAEILDFELSASEYERGVLLGLDEELISSTRLDNLATVHAGLWALLGRSLETGAKGSGKTGAAGKGSASAGAEGKAGPAASGSPPAGGGGKAGPATSVFCCFDNEEVGNRSRQGAESPMLSAVLERIVLALGGDRSDFLRSVHRSFMISADMAHAVHPNVPERSDPVTKVKLNGGPVIKVSGMQKFTTDSRSSAVFKALCEEAGVPWQYYLNRSDSPGGSTAGTASSTGLGMPAVDVGAPLLAMHSIREIGGTEDHRSMLEVYRRLWRYEE